MSAAILKVSNDRRSGERGSAGLERRAPRHDENGGDAIEMLDRLASQTAPPVAAPGEQTNWRRGRSWRKSRSNRLPHCRAGGREARAIPAQRQPRRRRKRARRGRDGRVRTTRQSAAPAPRAPANCRIDCCNGPNASGHPPPSATASVYDGSGLAQEPPSRTLARFSRLVFGDDWTAAESIGDAEAEVADRYSIAAVGGIRREVYEARSAEVGVAVFNAPEHIVGQGVLDAGADSPTVGIAAIGDERSGSGQRV